jgi:carbonic anhydrase
MELESVRTSIANLRTFPFVTKREDAGTLTLRRLTQSDTKPPSPCGACAKPCVNAALQPPHAPWPREMELESVRTSIANLRTFPFVTKREDAGTLTLRGRPAEHARNPASTRPCSHRTRHGP